LRIQLGTEVGAEADDVVLLPVLIVGLATGEDQRHSAGAGCDAQRPVATTAQ